MCIGVTATRLDWTGSEHVQLRAANGLEIKYALTFSNLFIFGLYNDDLKLKLHCAWPNDRINYKRAEGGAKGYGREQI